MIKLDLNEIKWCKLTRSVIFDNRYSRKLYHQYAKICLPLWYTLIALDILMPCKFITNDFFSLPQRQPFKVMAAYQTVFPNIRTVVTHIIMGYV